MKTERECYQVMLNHLSAESKTIEKNLLVSPELCFFARAAIEAILDFALDIGLITPDYHVSRIGMQDYFFDKHIEKILEEEMEKNEND